MSEIFHQNGIATERTLVSSAFGRGRGHVDQRSRSVQPPQALAFLLSTSSRDDSRHSRQSWTTTLSVKCATRLAPHLRGERKYAFFAEEIARIFARPRPASKANTSSVGWNGTATTSWSMAESSIMVRSASSASSRQYRYDDVDRLSTACRSSAQSPVHRPVFRADPRLPGHRPQAQGPALPQRPLAQAL